MKEKPDWAAIFLFGAIVVYGVISMSMVTYAFLYIHPGSTTYSEETKCK